MLRSIFPLILLMLCPMGAHASAGKIKIGLNWKAEPEFGGFYAAEANGRFKANGVDVDIIEGGAGTPTIQMLVAGKIDYGIVSGEELTVARSQGRDLVAVFTVYQRAPYVLMAHASKGFKTLQELMNSNVTLSLMKGMPLASWLENRFGFKTVKVVPYQGGISNFLADQNFVQQGFFASEPRLAEKAGAKTKVFLLADEGFNPYVAVMAVRRETWNKNPTQVKALVQSVRSGWEDYFKNPAAAHSVISKLNPAMDPETLKSMHPIEKSVIESELTKKSGFGRMDVKRWEQLIQQMTDLKLLKAPVQASEIFIDL